MVCLVRAAAQDAEPDAGSATATEMAAAPASAMGSPSVNASDATEAVEPAETSAARKDAAIASTRDSSATIPPLQSSVARDASKSAVAINWENVTLKDCIEVLSRDLGMEFIISPSVNVSQEVSIRAGDVTSWDREQKLEMFDAILETAGVQRIQRGRVWVFAPSDIRPVLDAAAADNYSEGKPIIGIVHLRNIDAASAQQFLNTVGGKPPRVFGVAGSRMLAVLGTKAYLKEVEELVRLIDLPSSLMVHYELKEASAEDMARELTSIFYRRSGGDGTPVRFIPIPRLNTIVAYNLPEGVVPEIDRWVKILDRADASAGRYTKVYHMQVIDAETTAKTLGQLYSNLYKQSQEREKEVGKTTKKQQAADARKDAAAAAKAAAPAKPSKGGAPAAAPAPAPAPVASSSGGEGDEGSSGMLDEEVIVLADKDTNTLIVNAPADMHKEIERTIRELDRSRRQVLIETVMVEVTLNESTDLGVEWAVQSGGDIVNSGSQMAGLQLGELASGAAMLNNANQGLNYLVTSTEKKMALIQAAENDNRLQVLSSPNVLTRDGMQAIVSFGKEVPVQQVSVTDAGKQNYSYDYRDAKITLTVTPHIDDHGMVTLDLNQVVRRVETDLTSDTAAPTFSTREITSNLQVENGQTLILGGLIERNDSKVRVGIPYLNRIPYLGWLFGRNIVSRDGTEILMILTPRVVDARDETDLLTRDFRRKILGAMAQDDIRNLYGLKDDAEAKPAADATAKETH